MKHKDVKDIRVIDMLIIKVSGQLMIRNCKRQYHWREGKETIALGWSNAAFLTFDVPSLLPVDPAPPT